MKELLAKLKRQTLTYRLGLRMTEEDRRRVETVAEAYGVTLSEAARALLLLGLQASESDSTRTPILPSTAQSPSKGL